MDVISSWSCMLPLLMGLIWLWFLSKESLLILIVVFLACIPQAMHALNIKNTTAKSLSYNLYTPVEFFLFFIVFYQHVEKEKNKLLLKITSLIYCMASVFFVVYFNISRRFISEWAVLNNIFYTAWILIIFFEQYAYDNDKALSFQDAFFWYVIGLLFYAPTTVMIFSMWEYMTDNNNSILKMVHEVFNINMYVLFCIGFFKEYKFNKSFFV